MPPARLSSGWAGPCVLGDPCRRPGCTLRPATVLGRRSPVWARAEDPRTDRAEAAERFPPRLQVGPLPPAPALAGEAARDTRRPGSTCRGRRCPSRPEQVHVALFRGSWCWGSSLGAEVRCPPRGARKALPRPCRCRGQANRAGRRWRGGGDPRRCEGNLFPGSWSWCGALGAEVPCPPRGARKVLPCPCRWRGQGGP